MHVFGVWFINFHCILNLVFQAFLALLSLDLSAEMPNNTAMALIVFDLFSFSLSLPSLPKQLILYMCLSEIVQMVLEITLAENFTRL